MTWDSFLYFALSSIFCWTLGALMAWLSHRRIAHLLTIIGSCIFLLFIFGLWHTLERPPFRTMGETRLWYAFFLSAIGLAIYSRWHYRWMLTFSTLLASVFATINILHPEMHDKWLMPALQSPWFIPHVIVYIFAYALLGAATIVATYLLFARTSTPHNKLRLCDHLTALGVACLTLGMLLGAVWAKDAWGHYWTWDPKEIWAALTWSIYLLYIHFRHYAPQHWRTALLLLLIAFVALQICWWCINYLPSAIATSVHVY